MGPRQFHSARVAIPTLARIFVALRARYTRENTPLNFPSLLLPPIDDHHPPPNVSRLNSLLVSLSFCLSLWLHSHRRNVSFYICRNAQRFLSNFLDRGRGEVAQEVGRDRREMRWIALRGGRLEWFNASLVNWRQIKLEQNGNELDWNESIF